MSTKIKFSDVRKVKKLSLPSYEGSEIEIYDRFTADQQDEILSAETDFERGILALQLLIKSWNFVDDNEKEIPVNKESLGKLPAKDFNFLLEEVSKIITGEESKKKANSKK